MNIFFTCVIEHDHFSQITFLTMFVTRPLWEIDMLTSWEKNTFKLGTSLVSILKYHVNILLLNYTRKLFGYDLFSQITLVTMFVTRALYEIDSAACSNMEILSITRESRGYSVKQPRKHFDSECDIFFKYCTK